MAFVWFLHVQTMYKLYKMYANVNQIIDAASDVCFVYTKFLHSLLLEFFHSIRMSSSVLFCNFLISGPIFSYSKRLTDEFIL